eukprot:TRINITY_DN1403_c0_g1_i2.p1 TRINITY_DN1403_c0_g1~~TRINITY_DN1403_c0_g1_i2.p1  ORF type:complete len:504 (-),score=29.19 TRINITY_DN1403_c0_g1_i2:3-1514(-)
MKGRSTIPTGKDRLFQFEMVPPTPKDFANKRLKLLWETQREVRLPLTTLQKRKAIIAKLREISMQHPKPTEELKLYVAFSLYYRSKPASLDNRQRFASKIMLYDYLTSLPANLDSCWYFAQPALLYNRIMYAMPLGVKCLISASNGVTTLRDKTGSIITTLNTYLPNGNAKSTNKQTTLLQGVYNPSAQTLYITDIMMWNDELLIDLVGDARLHIAFDKIAETPDISNKLTDMNEVTIRFPNIYYCSKEGLHKSYYGLYSEISQPSFHEQYKALLYYAQSNNLLEEVNEIHADPFNAEKVICSKFAYDNTGVPYIKDGIAFVKREGFFIFGFATDCFLWKDAYVSPHFGRISKKPLTAKLLYTLEGKLQTYDGYDVIYSETTAILKANTRYIVEFENIDVVGEWQVELKEFKVVKEANSVLWDTLAKMMYKLEVSKQKAITFEDIDKSLPEQFLLYLLHGSSYHLDFQRSVAISRCSITLTNFTIVIISIAMNSHINCAKTCF